MTFRRTITILAAISLGAIGLTGCDWEHPEDRKFEACLEAGGSWITNAWASPSCVMPGYEEER